MCDPQAMRVSYHTFSTPEPRPGGSGRHERALREHLHGLGERRRGGGEAEPQPIRTPEQRTGHEQHAIARERTLHGLRGPYTLW